MEQTLKIENARIFFRNFSGKQTKFNPPGKRNFCVYIPEDAAEVMAEDGWNIKYTKPRDEDDEPRPYTQVAVGYEKYPPKVWLISGKSKTLLDEETVSSLDYAEIENVDLVIRPYSWNANGKSGVKAYLKKAYITVVQDDLDMKYRDFNEDDDGDLPWDD